MSHNQYGRSQLSSTSYIPNRRYSDSPQRQSLTTSAPSNHYERKSEITYNDELLSIYKGFLCINANESAREALRKSVEESIKSWKNIESTEEQLEQKRQKKIGIIDKISESEVSCIKKYWDYIQADRKGRLVEGDLLFTENLINELQNEDGSWPDIPWELPMFSDSLEGEMDYIGNQDDFEVEMSEPQDQKNEKDEEYEIA